MMHICTQSLKKHPSFEQHLTEFANTQVSTASFHACIYLPSEDFISQSCGLGCIVLDHLQRLLAHYSSVDNKCPTEITKKLSTNELNRLIVYEAYITLASSNKTRKPCCRKETARCYSCSFQFKVQIFTVGYERRMF